MVSWGDTSVGEIRPSGSHPTRSAVLGILAASLGIPREQEEQQRVRNCITGLRLTPVSTKSIDAAAVLYEAYRPRPAGGHWPTHAVWPEHGLPRADQQLLPSDTPTPPKPGRNIDTSAT